MSNEKRPTTKPVARKKLGDTTYVLYGNGELWTTGRHGYRCGYVNDPGELDYAIEEWEEELRCIMMYA